MRDELLASERCDRCGAQAYTQWTNGLLFCAHHNGEHEIALDVFCAHHNGEHEIALDVSGERMTADMRHRLEPRLVDAE